MTQIVESMARPAPETPVDAGASRGRSVRRGQVVGLVACVLLVGAPLATTVAASLGLVGFGAGADRGFTFRYLGLLTEARFVRSLGYTLLLGVGGTFLALIGATLLATISTRTKVPFANRWWMRWIPVLPFLLPSVLVFFGWNVLYADRVGLVNLALREITGSAAELGPIHLRTLPTLLVAMAAFLTPVAYVAIHGALQATPPELEQAAQVFGAGWRRVLATVTLPLARPAFGAAVVLTLVLGIGNFVVPATIRIQGVSTLPLSMESSLGQSPADYGSAAVMALVLLAICVVALILRQRWLSSGDAQLPHRAGLDGTRVRLELGKLRWIAFGIFIAYAIFAAVLPILGLGSLSLRPFWTTSFARDSFSLDNFRNLSRIAPFASSALRNSALIAVIAATITLVFGVWLARLISRGGRLGAALETISLLPAAIPGILIGASTLFVTLGYVPSAYGTRTPVVIAYMILFLPYCVQMSLAAIRSIPSELEMASAVFGASRFQTMRRVVVPMIAPQLVAAWTLCAVLSVREVEAAVMIQTRAQPLAGPEMLNLWGNGYATTAAALGLQLLIVSVLVALLGAAVLGVMKLQYWLRIRSIIGSLNR